MSIETQDKHLNQCGQCSAQKGGAFNLLGQMFALLTPPLS